MEDRLKTEPSAADKEEREDAQRRQVAGASTLRCRRVSPPQLSCWREHKNVEQHGTLLSITQQQQLEMRKKGVWWRHKRDRSSTVSFGSFVHSSRDRQQRHHQGMEIQKSKAVAGLESAKRDQEYSQKIYTLWRRASRRIVSRVARSLEAFDLAEAIDGFSTERPRWR